MPPLLGAKGALGLVCCRQSLSVGATAHAASQRLEPKPQSPILAAMFFDSPDLVQMRKGGAYVGTVKHKVFTVAPAGGGKSIKVRKANIAWIIFRNDYGYGLDHVQLHDGTEIRGDVQDETIVVHSESMGDVEVKLKNVLSLQLPPSLG